jgi:hypothetical protein
MRSLTFDVVTRHAASARSRGSFLALGGATLVATLVSPILGQAKKKKKGPDCKKKEKQRCNNDAEDCKFTVLINCPTPDGCLPLQRCCEACSATGFLECTFNQM